MLGWFTTWQRVERWQSKQSLSTLPAVTSLTLNVFEQKAMGSSK